MIWLAMDNRRERMEAEARRAKTIASKDPEDLYLRRLFAGEALPNYHEWLNPLRVNWDEVESPYR